ncbi:hypothetical protein BC830DRAFT_568539 [Chytriomyces sp. MP71]|nr:hypothetical protein BC830DRAFT_568539 [Chytriomyces sp. MP71]
MQSLFRQQVQTTSASLLVLSESEDASKGVSGSVTDADVELARARIASLTLPPGSAPSPQPTQPTQPTMSLRLHHPVQPATAYSAVLASAANALRDAAHEYASSSHPRLVAPWLGCQKKFVFTDGLDFAVAGTQFTLHAFSESMAPFMNAQENISGLAHSSQDRTEVTALVHRMQQVHKDIRALE